MRRKKRNKKKQQTQKGQLVEKNQQEQYKTDSVGQATKHNTTLLQQAIAHHQAGRLQQAEKIYQHIIEVEPENANAYHFLGVLPIKQEKMTLQLN